MAHAFHRVEAFDIVGPYTLALQFDDGTCQQIDFRPVLEGEVFGPRSSSRSSSSSQPPTRSCSSGGSLANFARAASSVWVTTPVYRTAIDRHRLAADGGWWNHEPAAAEAARCR